MSGGLAVSLVLMWEEQSPNLDGIFVTTDSGRGRDFFVVLPLTQSMMYPRRRG